MNSMHNSKDVLASLRISGIPDGLPRGAAAAFRARLIAAVKGIADHTDPGALRVCIASAASHPEPDLEADASDPQPQFSVRPPSHRFEQLILPAAQHEDLLAAIRVLAVEAQVFDRWGLRRVEPYARAALNFYGPPGTGKTLAAHALASHLGRPILVASYADIESKYHGDGPKNVKALFEAADRQRAVLFIDEADSLLSKRLTNVTQGSEQAINSMRSQLLIHMEQFRGIAIFATNLVENYDRAFETRIRHVAFSLPDAACRERIWEAHLVEELPRADCVDCAALAAMAVDVCGREIKNAVIDAAVLCALESRSQVTQSDLVTAIERIKLARMPEFTTSALTPEDTRDIKEKLSQRSVQC